MASLPKPVFMPNTPFQEGAHAAAKKSAPFHGGAAPRRLDLEFDEAPPSPIQWDGRAGLDLDEGYHEPESHYP